MVGQWKCRAALTQGHSKSSMQFFPVFVRLGKIWRGSINEKGYDLGISYIIYYSLHCYMCHGNKNIWWQILHSLWKRDLNPQVSYTCVFRTGGIEQHFRECEVGASGNGLNRASRTGIKRHTDMNGTGRCTGSYRGRGRSSGRFFQSTFPAHPPTGLQRLDGFCTEFDEELWMALLTMPRSMPGTTSVLLSKSETKWKLMDR